MIEGAQESAPKGNDFFRSRSLAFIVDNKKIKETTEKRVEDANFFWLLFGEDEGEKKR